MTDKATVTSPLLPFHHGEAQRFRRPYFAIVLFGIALGCAIQGCAAPERVDTAPISAHVVIFPGVSGPAHSLMRVRRLIQGEMPDTSAQILDWTSLEGDRFWLGNLQDLENNCARADEIASRLTQWRRGHPETRLYLIGHSGGAGMVLLTVERLAVDFAIERILLVSGAVSHTIDLSRALAASREGIVAYRSPMDLAVLHAGTTLFGTMDRSHEPSAGCVGFAQPGRPELAQKLIQISWKPEDIWLGNLGGHIGALAPTYFKKKLLPYFKYQKEPDRRSKLVGSTKIAQRPHAAVRNNVVGG